MENRVYASNQPKFKPSSSFTWIIVVVQSLSPIQIHYHCITCSSHGLTVFHCLLEFAKVHVHWVGDGHLTISSSVISSSSCLQSYPGSGSFPMSQRFTSGGQSIEASASVPPINIQDLFPLGWIGWISLQSKGLSRVFSNTTVQKHQFFGTQLSL